MELGVVVWLTDRGVGIADLALAVERAGLESLFLTEHTHVPVSRGDVIDGDPHDQDPRILDQFTALGAAAAITSRLKLGTGICIVPQRDPIILAKQVATIDFLSGGRFLFGVGVGWLVEEMRNHGVRPRLRWALMRERILAMKQIWTQDEAEFHGEYVDFDPIWQWPKPVQRPHPPVLVGGQGPWNLGVAAECGDGWMPIVTDWHQFQTRHAELHRLCAEAGRAGPDVTVCLMQPDEQLLACCAELGVKRCVVVAPSRDMVALQSFLDRFLGIAERVCR
jgi:probable F420-dependent oxidoreductase